MSKAIQEVTKIMSKTTPNGEVNFEPMDSDVADKLNGTEVTDSDGDRVKIKDTGKTLTEDDTSMHPGQKLETQDIMNITKDLNTVVKDTLREHGDTVAYTEPKINVAKTHTIIYVHYEQDPDNPGKPSEDKFVFKFSNDKVYLEGVEICPLIKQSGTLTINKDLAKNGLMFFLDKSEDSMGEGTSTEGDYPNGQGFESKDMEAQDSYKTDNKELSEANSEINQVRETIIKAKAKPNHMFSVVYNGFRFNITFKADRFEAIQFFEPMWGHSRSYYGTTEEDILAQIKDAAENDSVYKDGGKYNMNEELLLGFRKAADAYKANPKDKETIKELFRQARNFEGDSIQAKLKNAIKQYLASNSSEEVEPAAEPMVADEPQVVSPQDDRTCPADIVMDMSLFIRLLEFTREDMPDDDVPIHIVAENLDRICKEKGHACMDDYEDIISGVEVNHEDKDMDESIDLTEVEEDDSERLSDVLHRAHNLDQVGGQDLRDAVMDAMSELYDAPESLEQSVESYIKHTIPNMTVDEFKRAVDYVFDNINKYVKD